MSSVLLQMCLPCGSSLKLYCLIFSLNDLQSLAPGTRSSPDISRSMINRRHFAPLKIFKFHYKQNYDSTQLWFIDQRLIISFGTTKGSCSVWLWSIKNNPRSLLFYWESSGRKMIHHFMNYGRVYRNSFISRWHSFEGSFYLEHCGNSRSHSEAMLELPGKRFQSENLLVTRKSCQQEFTREILITRL